MSRPVRKRRLTLAKEFRNSVKAGPRVWLIVAVAFLCLVVLPLLSKLASLLAMVLVGVGLLFIAPAILSTVLGVLIGHFREAVTVRMFTHVAGVSSPMKQSGESSAELRSLRRDHSRSAEVIEVESGEV